MDDTLSSNGFLLKQRKRIVLLFAVLLFIALGISIVVFTSRLNSYQSMVGENNVSFSLARDHYCINNSNRGKIKKDLQTIKNLGFNRIRIITWIRYPNQMQTWPGDVFFTFPNPTPREIKSLKEYLTLVNQFALTYEFVFNLPDESGMYFSEGVTSQDYKKFINTLFSNIWVGKLERILFGGDLILGQPQGLDNAYPIAQIESHQKFTKEVWPFLLSLCPECNTGIEILSTTGALGDLGVTNINWIKDNFSPKEYPKFLAVQHYTPEKGWLDWWGYKKLDTYDWKKLVFDHYEVISNAVNGAFPIYFDEVGINMAFSEKEKNQPGNWFTESEQDEFFRQSILAMNEKGITFNIWTFADQPGSGSLFGLYTNDRKPKKVASNLPLYLKGIAVTAGLQYLPPERESVGLQYINQLFIDCKKR